MKLSKNLSYKESVRSFTAIRNGLQNKPGDSELLNMFVLANNCFQPIRDHFEKPIFVSSFFRSKELNKLVGGATKSDHVRGCAIDLDADVFGWISNSDIFHFVLNNLNFKTLIWEHGDDDNPDWVHISYEPGYNHLKKTLRAYKNQDGETKYKQWA